MRSDPGSVSGNEKNSTARTAAEARNARLRPRDGRTERLCADPGAAAAAPALPRCGRRRDIIPFPMSAPTRGAGSSATAGAAEGDIA